MKFIVQLEIFCFIVNFQLVKCQLEYPGNGTIYIKHGNETTTEPSKIHHEHVHTHHKKEELKKFDPIEPLDPYTFVALIEIMFSDGSRRNCTGAIIHDNVVVTAAHCFEKENSESAQLELTGSFVIIGTKQMFDTGYEQYLPIERVTIHPDFKGWRADVALVYTFAGMMSDKPGNVIPLAEGNSFTSVQSNVTVINWNQFKQKVKATSTTPFLGSGCSQSSEEKDTYFHKAITRPIYSNIDDWSKEDAKSSATDTYESALYMEDYTIFDIHSCKYLVKKLKPAIYQIENVNATLCYYTKNPNKVQANSGAPAIHRNHLVALAAGFVYNNDEHIVVATKMSCYCSWISENLPSGGEQIQCCVNCCNEMHFKSKQEVYY